MKNTVIRATAVAALSAFALAGCGMLSEDKEPVSAPTVEQEVDDQEEVEADAPAIEDDEAEDEAPAQDEAGPGVYQAEMYGGAIATAAVPGEAPADLEEFREATGQDPVGYLVVEVDNTDGSDEATLFEARVVDSEGKTYKYGEITEATYDWTDGHDDLLERQMELWDKYPYSVDPTAKTTVALIGPEVPEDIVSVFVDDSRAERVGDL